MKYIVLLFTLFLSCTSGTSRWEGSFVRTARHEFGREFDTLAIQRVAGGYRIVRKWRYLRVLEGKELPPEYKQLRYDAAVRNGGLQETASGLRYTLVNDTILACGTLRYHRLPEGR